MVLSGGGDECRTTANFYAVVRCYEVLCLASVEWIPRLSGSKPSDTEICYNILPHLLPSSPYRQHTKTLSLQKPSVPNIMGRRNKLAGMSAYGQVGSAKGGQWDATSSWLTLRLPD